ncbi:MAG: hypothetical protein HZA89_01915 [Verrucomicrobia bacterium]|nr:hypothetical protein [Verrucomicrobiota bacterium]
MKFRAWFFICGISVAVTASGDGGIAWSELRLRGAAIPIFLGTNSEPAAVIRVKNMGKDFRRMGFFRIGLLPMAVAEDVTVEFRRPEEMTNALSRAHNWFTPPGNPRVAELRRVVFLFPDSKITNRLEVARVRFAAKDEWQLLDGVLLRTPNQTTRGSSGTLRVAGGGAGLIRCNTDNGTAEFNLFTP